MGLWRNSLAGGLDRHEERLGGGARRLRSMRDGAHRWRKFPFWYTVLALSEIDNAEAKRELKYAAPALEAAASRAVPSSLYARVGTSSRSARSHACSRERAREHGDGSTTP